MMSAKIAEENEAILRFRRENRCGFARSFSPSSSTGNAQCRDLPVPLITHHLAVVVDDALPHHLPSRSSVRPLHCPVAVASVGVAVDDGAVGYDPARYQSLRDHLRSRSTFLSLPGQPAKSYFRRRECVLQLRQANSLQCNGTCLQKKKKNYIGTY